jgi:BlaI family transcriptional regulator, penicillinase repressor
MPRNTTERLTPLEFEIMSVLWETGPANVQAVQQRLPRNLAYTTVQTMLNILHRKKKVKRSLKDRAYFYTAAVSRRQVTRQTLSDVVERLFGGSASSLVMSLVETNHLTAEELARLNQLVTKTAESEKESDDKS